MYIATGEAVNNKSISINDMYGYGMSSDSGMLTNNDTIDLSNGGYGIKSNTGSVFNSKGATITITNTIIAYQFNIIYAILIIIK